MAGTPWTREDIEILGREYFTVLRAELRGEPVSKVAAQRRAQSQLPSERTLHTIEDRCRRISEELWKRDLPYVQGWRPSQLSGQRANTDNVGSLIWSAISTQARSLSSASPDRGDSPARSLDEEAESSDNDGQVYASDAELRAAIEDVAQQRIMAHYRRLGWQVEDTHLTSPFDARATKAGQVQYLEAKGTMSQGLSVFVTRGEVDWARQHPGECVMGIVSGISLDQSGAVDAASGSMRLVDWVPDDGALSPIQYEWRPPA